MGAVGDVGREFLGRMRSGANERLDEQFSIGFNEAANLCVDLLNQKINGLMNKITSDGSLSTPEQHLLAGLNSLKSEMEQGLYDYPGVGTPTG